MRRKLAALLAVALLGAAGCGESAESDDPDPPPRGDQGSGASTEVRATDFAFDPELIEVDPGQDAEITLVNAGNVAHTFTSEELDVDVEAASGAEASATFTAPDEDGTFEYVCRFHPQMKGEVVVGGGSEAGGPAESEDVDY
ncbi:MAG: cupredoxin domain-containing protein [Actinomycetota bacterium]|nr:cupredoxin domain-containing protein [Actinomycetota bacterium]